MERKEGVARTHWLWLTGAIAIVFIVSTVWLSTSVTRSLSVLSEHAGLIRRLMAVESAMMAIRRQVLDASLTKSIAPDSDALGLLFGRLSVCVTDVERSPMLQPSDSDHLGDLHRAIQRIQASAGSVADLDRGPPESAAVQAAWHQDFDRAQTAVSNVVTSARSRMSVVSMALHNAWNALYGLLVVSGAIAAGFVGLLAMSRRRSAQLAQTLTALRASEERFRGLFEDNLAGIFRSTVGGQVLSCNAAMARMLGYDSPQQFLSLPSAAFYKQPSDRDAYLEKLRTHRRLTEFEIRLQTKDGRTIWVLENVALVSDPQLGEVIEGTVVDITNLKRAEEALRQQQRRLRTIFDSEPECVKIVCLNGVLLEINAAGLRMIGAESGAEVIGRCVFDLIHMDDRAAFTSLHAQVCAGGQGTLQFRINNLRGGMLWMESNAAPLHDDDGRVVAVLSVTRDITDRRRIERALRESESRYRLLYERNLAGVFRSTRDGRVIECNEAFARMLGFESPHQVVGAPALSLYFDPAERRRMIEHLEQSSSLLSYELRLRRADGSPLWVLENKTLVRGCDGEPEIIEGTVIDMTERKRAEQLLAEQNYVLELLALGRPLGEVLAALCQGVERCSQGTLCSILLLDSDQRRLRLGAAPSLPEEYNRAVDGLSIGPAVGCCGTAAHTGQRVVVEDISSSPLWKGFHEVATRHGLSSCWSEPIKSVNNTVLGTFALYHRHPCIPAAGDLRLIETATHLAGLAIERRRAEEALRAAVEFEHLLFMELDHRVRNNLTSLLTLIDMTRRSTPDIGAFATSIMNRVHAMASIHGLLSKGHWGPVDLAEVLTSIVPPEYVDQVRLDGPSIGVPAEQATALGMVLHELTVNSIKYGALSVRSGHIRAAWTAEDFGDACGLVRLTWSESGGPPLESGHDAGIGTQLILGLVKSELHGTVDLNYPSTGVLHVLTMRFDGSDGSTATTDSESLIHPVSV